VANYLDSLIGKVADGALRMALRGEVDRLRDTKEFGLVFERHLPEMAELPAHPVKAGFKVRPRREPNASLQAVVQIEGGVAVLVDEEGELSTRPTGELIVVREFGEPVYPGLTSVSRVDRGGDKPYHIVINAENFYALETMAYLYRGRVDCIYIDPPYNTGDRNWQYNNDYVDASDSYRHSKWLSFIERRLRLARQLLKPGSSCLVVTIDEHEVHHLGVLLEQIFPGTRSQLVTIVVNPLGQARRQELSRVEEYAFVLFFGDAGPAPSVTAVLGDSEGHPLSRVRWEWLLRGGTNADRASRPNLFYPVFVDPVARRIMEVGEPLPRNASRQDVAAKEGLETVWPLRTSGEEGRWRLEVATLRKYVAQGFAKVGRYNRANGRWSILYLGDEMRRRIDSGVVSITKRDSATGAVEVAYNNAAPTVPKTVWTRNSHRSGEFGSRLVAAFLGGRRFSFPKSLYAVADTLQMATGHNKDALIVDFFAGSGTTLHAAAILNREDGGQRSCVLVTNNEVDGKTFDRLKAAGLGAGDSAYEASGVFWAVTKPRVEAAITGHRPDGRPVEGRYLDGTDYADGLEENVEFLELTYLDHDQVARGKAFEQIAPLLWLKAGATGTRISQVTPPFAIPAGARYGVLFDVAGWRSFARELDGRPEVTEAFIVTDSLAQYQQIAAELRPAVRVSMLYDDYLRNFEINGGGAL
jgi:adenine-specific DNA-methyltransferase